MGIDMSNYKMIYKDHVYNIVNIIPCFENISNGVGDNAVKISQIDAWYIDEDGKLKMVQDKADNFSFIRR